MVHVTDSSATKYRLDLKEQLAVEVVNVTSQDKAEVGDVHTAVDMLRKEECGPRAESREGLLLVQRFLALHSYKGAADLTHTR